MTSCGSKTSKFIGRRRELAALNSALGDALSGKGQMVMLTGEPGIGKTRLAQELASLAESSGAQVLWGWCYEHVGAPPYWPYAQPIRAYAETADHKQLSFQMGPGGADIAEIVPALKKIWPDLGQPSVLEPEQARFRLFDSIATFLKNASQSQPLVFVIDDLHWADESSLLLLEFLTREIAASPLLILGTYRDAEVTGRHPLSQTLGNLVREQHFRRVRLGGLSQEEVGEFAEAKIGLTLPSNALDTIYSRTEGNPLFVNEVVALIDPQNIIENRAWANIIPDGVRDAIGRRLNRVSSTCNQVLRTASVIGREFEFSLLGALDSEVGPDAVLEALDEALEAGLIQRLPTVAERYQFGHALIQQALYEALPSTQRLRAHARIGETLEHEHQTNLAEHAAELAHHFSGAEAVLGPEKVSRYSLMAGERALASFAYEDAFTHFEKGLATRGINLSGTEAVYDDEAAALLFGLAKALSATSVGSRHEELFAAVSRSFDYYAEVGNVPMAVATAEFPIAPAPSRIPGVAQLIARALKLVPSESHQAGRLLARYGGVLGLAHGDYRGAKLAMDQAIVIARREGDASLEVQTLAYAADVSGQNLHWQESIETGLRAIEIATGNENTYSRILPRWWITVSLLHQGALDAARTHSLVLRELTKRRSTPKLLASISFAPIISLSCLEGDWRTARENVDRGLGLSPLHQQLLGLAVLLEHETGESAQGEVYMQQLLEAADHRPNFFATGRTSMTIAAIARITGVPDRFDIAEALAMTVLSDPAATPALAMYANAGLALLAVQKSDRSVAEQRYADFLGQRGTMLWTTISVDRLLGLLSQTMENIAQAASHFEDALAFCRKAGYRPELAWTCCDYADTLLKRYEEGDHPRATSLLNESLSISIDLGMRPLMKRVVALQEQQLLAEAQPDRLPTYPNGLTQREVDVLLLIAQGKTTREVAEALFLSPRTVQRHISNLYSKIDVRNRVEATAYTQNEPSITPRP